MIHFRSGSNTWCKCQQWLTYKTLMLSFYNKTMLNLWLKMFFFSSGISISLTNYCLETTRLKWIEIVNFSFTDSVIGTLERNFKTMMLRERRKSNDIGLQMVFNCESGFSKYSKSLLQKRWSASPHEFNRLCCNTNRKLQIRKKYQPRLCDKEHMQWQTIEVFRDYAKTSKIERA